MFQRLFRRAPAEAPDEAKIDQGLARTRRGLRERLGAALGASDITDDTWDELEAQLIQADVGVTTSAALVADLRREAKRNGIRRADELVPLLGLLMAQSLRATSRAALDSSIDGPVDAADGRRRPHVILVVGVNGSGKTTSIAKLAALHGREGRSTLLVAADTFRAAAIEQLQRWGERAGAQVVAGQPGADPGAVVFDALSSAAGRRADVVIVDTAGRLHTQANLMAELVKVRSVAAKVVAGAPHETILVLDATTGQNGLAQARSFTERVEVTGLVLAKLDSSAKGGVAFAVSRELGLPIQYVGTGEDLDDLAHFDPDLYVAAMLGGDGVPASQDAAESTIPAPS